MVGVLTMNNKSNRLAGAWTTAQILAVLAPKVAIAAMCGHEQRISAAIVAKLEAEVHTGTNDTNTALYYEVNQ